MTGSEFKKLYLSKHKPKECQAVLGVSHMTLYRLFKAKKVDQLYADKLSTEVITNAELFYLKEKIKDMQMIIDTQALLIKKLSK